MCQNHCDSTHPFFVSTQLIKGELNNFTLFVGNDRLGHNNRF